jgi:zinc metalloprotease ZmpB
MPALCKAKFTLSAARTSCLEREEEVTRVAFSLSPAVEVERDISGAVRSLNHTGQPYGVGLPILNAQKLAESYLEDVASIYAIDPGWLGALDLRPSDAIESADTELRFAQQDSSNGTGTVSFQQTHFGLPVWQAGFTASLLTDVLRVTASLSTLHPAFDIKEPKQDAKCMAGRITSKSLSELIKTDGGRGEIVINAERLWIYRYDAAQRLGIGSPTREGGQHGGFVRAELPSLPVSAVTRGIVDGQHYVVTEVLFDLPLPPRFPRLHWRAFIEVNTCSVLYLRPLIDLCTGSVYLTDPTTATGDLTITPSSPATVLDPLRSDVTLQGLTPATPQVLTGAYASALQGSGPDPSPTVTPPPCDFTYSVPTSNFAAVCAYYHVDELFRLVESFGYSPITTFFQNTTLPLPVYFLDLTDVNSDAAPNALGNGFGWIDCGFEQTGSTVGIATDWRITMHEFVHGMLDDRTHSGVLGFAHNGGDGFGAIYMDPGSQAPDRFVSFPWCTAIIDESGFIRRQDRDVAAGWAWGGTFDNGSGGYQSEEILSTTLFRIYRSTGGDSPYFDKQQLASRYILLTMTRAMASLPLATTTPTTATSYAQSLINADAGLTTPFSSTVFGGAVSVPGGAIGKVIRWSFEKQGLYQPAGAPTPVTTPGAPPSVDVYINDGYYGEYAYQEDFWDNTNIWNLLSPDPSTTPVDHQTPIVGQTNYGYVYLSNRGTQPASNVVVSGYHCRPSAGLLWPDDWQPMTTASITVPGTIAPGAMVLVGPFEWTPTEVGHECMLMVASATGDLSNADPASGLPCATGPTPHWRLVPFDNNMGQRNVAPVAGGSGVTGLMASFGPRRFWVNNPYDFPGRIQLEVVLPDFLSQKGWAAEFVNAGGASFTLTGRGSREVLLGLKAGSEFSVSDVEKAGAAARIVVRVLVNGIPVGGMTYMMDPNLKAPPAEYPGKGIARHCTEEAKDLLECLHVPVDEVKSVRIKRVTLDIELRTDCE